MLVSCNFNFRSGNKRDAVVELSMQRHITPWTPPTLPTPRRRQGLDHVAHQPARRDETGAQVRERSRRHFVAALRCVLLTGRAAVAHASRSSRPRENSWHEAHESFVVVDLPPPASPLSPLFRHLPRGPPDRRRVRPRDARGRLDRGAGVAISCIYMFSSRRARSHMRCSLVGSYRTGCRSPSRRSGCGRAASARPLAAGRGTPQTAGVRAADAPSSPDGSPLARLLLASGARPAAFAARDRSRGSHRRPSPARSRRPAGGRRCRARQWSRRVSSHRPSSTAHLVGPPPAGGAARVMLQSESGGSAKTPTSTSSPNVVCTMGE